MFLIFQVTILQPEMRSIVIQPLNANVSYDFKMRVFNLAGASDFSPVYKFIVAGELQVKLSPYLN